MLRVDHCAFSAYRNDAMRIAAPSLATACLLACSHATLPGTEIPDSPQNRAVLDVFSKYRDALEARDATSLLELAAPGYADQGDLSRGIAPTDHASLEKKLQTDFAKVTGIKLEATIKDIQVKGEEARVDYFQVVRYAVSTPSGERWKSESDDARMKLVKVGPDWKIASGL
jgi:hypothetical protein